MQNKLLVSIIWNFLLNQVHFLQQKNTTFVKVHRVCRKASIVRLNRVSRVNMLFFNKYAIVGYFFRL